MHRLLHRQIQHFLGDAAAHLDEDFRKLFEAVSDAYERADAEHFAIEHAMETVSHELTERNNDLRLKLAEHQVVARALRLSELNLRKAQEIAKVGSWFLDTRERRLQWSEEFKRILGIADDEPLLYERSFADGQSGENGFSGEIWSCIFSDQSHEIERRLEIDGVAKWVRIRSDSVHDEGGELIGRIGTIQDITEQKEAEILERKRAEELDQARARSEEALEKLRVSTQQLRVLSRAVEQSPVSIMITDIKGDIQYVNPRFEELTGYSSAEVVGRNSSILNAGVLPHSHFSELWQTILSGKVWQGELCNRKKSGELFWEAAKISAVRDDAGEIIHFVAAKEDVTESRKVAEELRLAKERAEEATAAKSMFLANMSHEIRTPLNAIVGMAYLSLKTELSPKQRDYLEKIHNAGAALRQIVDDILDFTKIEAGRMEIEQTGFALPQVLDHVFALFADRIEEKGLTLAFDLRSEVPRNLIGDPLRLGQILTNLVSNAVKFTERGEILVKVEVARSKGSKVELGFTVRDSGIGMTTGQAGRMFNAFTQADGSTTRKYGGTGLGLMICKRLVELMGGRIEVESQPDVGSTFRFSAWFGEAADAPQTYPDTLKSLRILLVDDSDLSRQAIMECLQNFPFSVIDEASSGNEALRAVRQMAQELPYDVVFMDWQMPGIDGMEATRRIKSDPALEIKPAIVMVTLVGSEEIRRKAEEAGADAFLVKPVNQSMLFDTLVELVTPASAIGALAAKRSSRKHSLSGIRVLLAEDNEVNRQLAVALLEEVGALVDVAANGREAVERVVSSKERYDMVLMDLQMPEMDGYQATAEIRALPRFKDQPIIAMTAHALIEECQRSREAGMDGHITKPIEPEVLYETLAKWHAPGRQTPAKSTVAPQPLKALDFPTIPGINTVDGLRRSVGNAQLYRSLLLQFAARQADAIERIGTAIDNEDFAQACHAAHAVKGVAGTLGAALLSEAAATLETALYRHEIAESLEYFTRFRDEMSTVLAAIHQALPEGQGEPHQPAPVIPPS